MKRLLLLMLLLVAVFQGYSQTQGISYQAVILNPNTQELPGVDVQGNILANTTVGIQFTITDASGNEEYQESHSTSTDMYGMINLLIGTGNITSDISFLEIVWNGTSKTLKVAIDFTGGADYLPLSEKSLTYMPQPATTETLQLITDNTLSIVEEGIRAMTAEATLTADVATNATAIATETTRATTAETTLQTNIDTEATTARAAELANATAISDETTRATAAEAALTTDVAANATDVAAEIVRATAAEGVNATAITTETTRAITAETTLQTNIDAEAGTARAAELANATAISDETTRVTAAEAALTTDIAANATDVAAEIVRATAAEGVNATAIANSAARATTAETTLQTNIDTEATTARAAELANATAISTLPTSLTGLSDALVETNSLYIGNNPSATTNDAEYNVAVGITALNSNTTGSRNTATGYNALKANTTGESNIATGYNALKANTTGELNIATGHNALKENTTGSFNVAVGSYVLSTVQNAENNTAMGTFSMIRVTSGSNNSGFGRGTLENTTTGENNVAIGHNAGDSLITGSSNVIIGNGTDTSSDNGTNQIVIGYNAKGTGNNTVQLGNTSITNVKTSGTLTAGEITIPNIDGTNGQVLATNGSGVLSWVAATSGVGTQGIQGIQGEKGDTGDAAAFPTGEYGDLFTHDGTNWVAKKLSVVTSTARPFNNRNPYLGINYIIALQGIFPSRDGTDPFIAEISMFGGSFAPRGWAFCDGQLLAISQNQALFALLSTTYGGDGRTSFGLPDLRGRTPVHAGTGPGLSSIRLGHQGGFESITIREQTHVITYE